MRKILAFLCLFLLPQLMLGTDKAYGDTVSPSTPQLIAMHGPANETETILNEIIVHLATNDALMQGILSRRPTTEKLQEIADHFFTQALRQAWLQKDKELALVDCGKAQVAGQICGLDYDPFFCAQDIPIEPVLYNTIRSDKDTAIISVSWAKDGEVMAVYKLLKIGNTWKVDGISCAEGDAFNFHDWM